MLRGLQQNSEIEAVDRKINVEAQGESSCNLESSQESEYGAEHAVAEAGSEQGECHSHHLNL